MASVNNNIVMVPTGAATNAVPLFDGARWQTTVPNACRAKTTANQAESDATWTPVSLPAEDFDTTGDMHDNTTNNSRVYGRVAGRALICAKAIFVNSSAAGVRAAQIRRNGTIEVAYANQTAVTTGDYPSMNPTAVIEVANGDYFELWVAQISGGPIDLSGANGNSWLALMVIPGT